MTASRLSLLMPARNAVPLIGLTLCLLAFSKSAYPQQFNGDNQWVAPHGVGTFVLTAGQEYAQGYAVFALFPEWEFNAQLTYYYEDPEGQSDSRTATNLFVKRRLMQNEAETAGYAITGGTGLFPEYQQQGEVVGAFQSFWVAGVATYAFADDTVLLDILPGAVLNIDDGEEGDTAWGLSYSSRVAIYKVIPQSAIVGEVFGVAGEAYAKPTYRLGVRWESRKWIVAATYSNTFDGSGGAGFEIGAMFFTGPIFCFGGCK